MAENEQAGENSPKKAIAIATVGESIFTNDKPFKIMGITEENNVTLWHMEGGWVIRIPQSKSEKNIISVLTPIMHTLFKVPQEKMKEVAAEVATEATKMYKESTFALGNYMDRISGSISRVAEALKEAGQK